jgi:hypothetical protein
MTALTPPWERLRPHRPPAAGRRLRDLVLGGEARPAWARPSLVGIRGVRGSRGDRRRDRDGARQVDNEGVRLGLS